MHIHIATYFVALTSISRVLSLQAKPRTCTVWSRNNSLLNDVPEINYALEECGNAGTIVLNAEDTFNIRSPVDLSLCRRCEFRINGIMKISSDWKYWSKQSAVFRLSGVNNVIVSSDSAGTIDASDYGWVRTPGASAPDNMPKLFSIGDRSAQIYIRNQLIQNAPGTIFHIHTRSSADVQSYAKTGYEIENAHTWRNAVRASRSCVTIAQNTSNVQVEEMNCLATSEGNSIPNGIELRPYDGGASGATSIRNIFVRSLWVKNWANVISIISGQEGDSKKAELKNATFTNVDLGLASRRAVFVGPHRGTLVAKDVLFCDFTSTSQFQSDLKCPNPGDVCDFKQEGWNVMLS